MTVSLTRIADGNTGVIQTVIEMWRQILVYSPQIRVVAEAVLRDKSALRSPQYLKAAALYEWVQSHLIYTGDHLLVEEVRGPLYLLDDIAQYGNATGDCDDYVTLMGALFASIGLVFQIVTTSANPDGEFDHVFLVVDTELGPITADAITGEAFGWEVPTEAVTNRQAFPAPRTLEELGVYTVAALQGGSW